MKNARFLSAEELQKRWQIGPFDLLTRVKAGRIPWHSEKDIPSQLTMDTYVRHQMQRFELELKDLETFFFNKADIEDIEKRFPGLKPQDAPYVSPQGEIPPYLDNKHEYFSKELSIAVEAWLSIYGTPGNLNHKQGHKKQIKVWLENHHAYLSNDAKERIATMINCKKEGGAPKSEG